MNNSKVVIFLGCLFAATLSAPLVTAASHGGGGGHGGGFSGGHSFAGRPGMGMPGRPGMGMRSAGNRHDHFDHHHDHFFHHDVIFIGDFGFPWWWGWGWGPWWGWNWDYQYGYYGGYGSGYGYGDSSRSTVAELQRPLTPAGYYHGSIDGIMGPQTRRAIRAYERDHGGSAYGAIDQRLPFENQNKSQLLGC